MSSPARTFFDDLASRRHVPWLGRESGRLRVELVDEDCVQLWTVAFDNGDVSVDRDESEAADGVLRVDRAWFDRAVIGEEKLLPAVLRGEVNLDGAYGLLVMFGRLLPGPPGQTGPARARDGRRRSA
jgi:hypothetical protein